ncbi:MAG TPA: hypothetical protein VME41_14255 [Stellaceae bacterium]|nr:hypothetical protein [Stellaceae bacterium]
MTRLGVVFWLGLVAASGAATFALKYTVQGIDNQLQQTRRQIVAEEEEIRVLTAEWNYLNRPARLADLNQRFLRLAPISAEQLEQKIDAIPFRAPVIADTETPAVAGVEAPADAVAELLRQLAAAAPAAARAAPTPDTELPVAAAAYRTAAPAASASVQVAKSASPKSIDALFALVAEKR